MTIFDIIILIPLVWALYRGFKDGVVVQLGGLAGLLAGAYFAFRFGGRLGYWLGIKESTSAIVGFIIVFILVIIAVALLGRALRHTFRAAGLGVLDKVGGMILSALKVALILGLFVYCFDWINRSEGWVEQASLNKSLFFKPLVKIADFAFPYIDFLKDKIIDTIHPE